MSSERIPTWYVDGMDWYDDVMRRCNEDPGHTYAFVEGLLDGDGVRHDAVVMLPCGVTETQAMSLCRSVGATGIILFDDEGGRE